MVTTAERAGRSSGLAAQARGFRIDLSSGLRPLRGAAVPSAGASVPTHDSGPAKDVPGQGFHAGYRLWNFGFAAGQRARVS
jgi:hypothetical protein